MNTISRIGLILVSEERKQLLPKSVKSETRMVAGSDALMVAQETAIASRVNPTNQIVIYLYNNAF